MKVLKGNSYIMGCNKIGHSYNFAYESKEKHIALILYKRLNNGTLVQFEEIQLDNSYKAGDVFSCVISGISLDKCYYVYRVENELKTDPYGVLLTDRNEFGQEETLIPNSKSNIKGCNFVKKVYYSRVSQDSFNWESDANPNTPWSDTVIYKLHVRGFTKSETSRVRYNGTFAGVEEKIPYLKKLGITAIELMPCYDYFERYRGCDVGNNMYSGASLCKLNYWGYTDAFYFTPKPSFSYALTRNKEDYTVEFKSLIKALHKNGIEVIMEFYFNEKTPGFIIDCIRFWVKNYHIDGIHLYASDSVISFLESDPLLKNVKIIFNGSFAVKNRFGNLASPYEAFSVTMRKYLKGDDNQLRDVVKDLRHNTADKQIRYINYITTHNGFTLMDLVSFDRKHNEGNGENNRDGENYNYSWNCGAEGRTTSRRINELREKQQKNAFTMLLTAQGIPLILAGDEFCNSQEGNNNPYCIDSEVTWLNWNRNKAAKKLTEYVTKLIEFRRENKILHMDRPLLTYDTIQCGYPDISYHGSSAWYNALENYNRHIGIMYCTKYTEKPEDTEVANNKRLTPKKGLIYTAFNMHWEEHTLALPAVAARARWEVLYSTEKLALISINNNREIVMPPRTAVILFAEMNKEEDNPK